MAAAPTAPLPAAAEPLWFAQPAEAVAASLRTDPSTGLSAAEATSRLGRYGATGPLFDEFLRRTTSTSRADRRR